MHGIEEDEEKSNKNKDKGKPSIKRVTVPIRRLPVLLEHAHKSTDPNFVGLGTAMALSRRDMVSCSQMMGTVEN